MKKLMSQCLGIVIGAVYTLASLLINCTFIMPHFFTVPVPAIFHGAYIKAGGTAHVYKINMYIFLFLGMTFLITSLFYYKLFLTPKAIEKLTFIGPLLLFLFLQLFLIHPFTLYAFSDWFAYGINVTFLKTYHTFPISSFSFIFMGLVADVIRNRWATRK